MTVLATIFATAIFGFVFYFGTQHTDYQFSLIHSLQFGCFISAIDPVATISIFKQLKVTELLFMIVLGEAVLNDAVAIALSMSVSHVQDTIHDEEAELSITKEIIQGTASFFSLFLFSMLIGFACGLFFSYLFKVLDLH